MPIRYRKLTDVSTLGTQPGPLLAGQLARRDRVLAVMTEADRLLGNGRRVLGRVGLHGEEAQQVGSGPVLSPTQSYPTKTDARIALRIQALLTPGSFPQVSALILPSGPTQYQSMGASWLDDDFGGWIDVTAVFSRGGGASETVTHTIALPTSEEDDAAEGQDDGWAWGALTRVASPILAPDGALDVNFHVDLQLWCEEVTCEITVAFRGGVRCVDLVVVERPHGYARDVGVDSLYSSTLAVAGAGQPAALYPSAYPLEKVSASDPTFGSRLLADVVDRQHHRLGPILAPWAGWRESQSVAALEAVGVSTTSLTFIDLVDATLTAWDEASPGWSLAAGGQAQQVSSSEPRRTTRDADACVPVRCWVYGKRTGGGTATVRFQSEDHAVADVAVTSSTPGWWSATGHLRCGLGPEDTSVLQILGRLGVAGTLTIHHFTIEYLDL